MAAAAVLCLLLCACGKKTEEIPAEPVPAVTPTPYVGAEPSPGPVQQPVPATGTEPTPAPDPETDVIVTKNPSDEVLKPDGYTWFIAHATNSESISWRFTDPVGTAHSVDETMALNPPLELEELPDDTIALRKVPESFNGWSVQASFVGNGRSVTTDSAFINVGDFETMYADIINKYASALADGIRDESAAAEHGVSSMITVNGNAGYAFRDLDRNGTPELIIATSGDNEDAENLVLAIYTSSGSESIKLIEAYPRSRVYLLDDGRIYNPGSSGAYNSSYSIYSVRGDRTVFEEAVYTARDGDSDDLIWYYSKEEGFREEDNLKVTKKEALDRMEQWENSIYLPEINLLVRN